MSVRSVDSNYQLMVRIDNVRNIYSLLKAINFHETATFFATEKGLKVTVEDSKCIQANAFIQAEVFQEYDIPENTVSPVTFCVDLNVLMECLNIFGDVTSHGTTEPTALKLMYKGDGNPVQILLEEDGVITECAIRTQQLEEIMNLDVSAATVSRAILQAEPLREMFTTLDPSTDLLEITLSPDDPHFKLAANSTFGETQIEIPKDSDVVELFECEERTKARYRYSHLKPMLPALQVSQKLSLRMDCVSGLLCLQFMAKTEDGHVCFIEFYCQPLVDED